MKKVVKQILKGKIMVNCQTLEECKLYLKWAESQGVIWMNQGKETLGIEFAKFRDYTAYKITDGKVMKFDNIIHFIDNNAEVVKYCFIKPLLLMPVIPIQEGDTVKFKDFVKNGAIYYNMHVFGLDTGSGVVIGRKPHPDCDSMIIQGKGKFTYRYPEAILEVVTPVEKKDNPLDLIQIEVKKIKALEKKKLKDAILALGAQHIYFEVSVGGYTKAQIIYNDTEYIGISKCSRKATYDENFGERLALCRALNKMTITMLSKLEKGIK